MKNIILWLTFGIADANIMMIVAKQLDKVSDTPYRVFEESTWLSIVGGLLTILGFIVWYYWQKKDKALEQAKVDHKEDIKAMKADWSRMMDMQLSAQRDLANMVKDLAAEVKENAVEMATLRGEMRGYQRAKGQRKSEEKD